MDMKKAALTILTMSMFAASSAMAASPGSEISASGSLDSSTSNSVKSTNTNVNLSYGYYLSSRLVVRANVFMTLADSAGSTTNMADFGVGAKYYFGDAVKSAWVPYAIADVVMVTGDAGGQSFSGYGFDGGVGVSNFITESVSFDIEGKLYSNSLDAGGATYTQDGTRINFGFTARF